MACVCAALPFCHLTIKPASVHYHIYRLVLKRLLLRRATSRGEKARPSQIQSALREMKRNVGYSLLPEKTQPGTGRWGGVGGKVI